MVCVEASPTQSKFGLRDYDLKATLTSGQAFRWRPEGDGWIGVIGTRWVRLRQDGTKLTAETAAPVPEWSWLIHYLQLDLELGGVLSTFPKDPPLDAAMAACRGLRLLRQDPWECLASFILSSTKQILQIEQIVSLVCHQFGTPVVVPPGRPSVHAFPGAERIAGLSETQLRACKMGFRAPFLLAAARAIALEKLDLQALHQLPLEAARAELMKLEGVGRKIADCVLLFAFGRQEAFPVDVWVMKVLRHFYFPHRPVSLRQLNEFAASHFGPHAGYAQQYLFHYARSHMKRAGLPSL